MYSTKKITDSIFWVGGNDRRLALFENLFPIPRGVSYNSYLIMDEKTTLMDTVDSSITRQFWKTFSILLAEEHWITLLSTIWNPITALTSKS